MTAAHILGFPRIGAQRELKFAVESFWKGATSLAHLEQTARTLRQQHWALQSAAGLDMVTVGDFAFYDQVLNMLASLGALPERFGFDVPAVGLEQYFDAARGNDDHFAMEMTKWFDTNYHYLVPEWTAQTRFGKGTNWLFEEIAEAQALGHEAKVVLIGPLTLLYQGKIKNGIDGKAGDTTVPKLAHKLDLLPNLVAAYAELLQRIGKTGVKWVQIDEPILALELDAQWLDAFLPTYTTLSREAPSLLLTTYFDNVSDHAKLLKSLPVEGLHIDLVRAPEQLAAFIDQWPVDKILSLGVVDGRNIWASDLAKIIASLQPVHDQLGERLWLGSSCSLLHVPVDLDNEHKLDPGIMQWLAYATQKLDELSVLKRALNDGLTCVSSTVERASAVQEARRTSVLIHNPLVQRRIAQVQSGDAERAQPFSARIALQRARFALPLFPTTTIGSFPQTDAIRKTRAAHKRGEVDHLTYLERMREEIQLVVEQQEKIGLDVFVHGEAERNDMVEYFGEQLWGYAFSENGWVQSYGSRCVKPPVIYGDVYRPEPMTVNWSRYAQSLTDKPMKGMLTGPVTMLQWSFVRDDQPRETTALQIALALRDEVVDLEAAGIGMIQIDEPAFREGLPLKRKEWADYLDWAVRVFKISSCGVSNSTQIHTHMCYSQFNDILPWIAAMDADVITIETSRSDMTLLDGFGEFDYPNDIGPGVYDIHAARLPRVAEMARLLDKARKVIPDRQLWVNPDCGLKTRGWPETIEALSNMVAAVKSIREKEEVS